MLAKFSANTYAPHTLPIETSERQGQVDFESAIRTHESRPLRRYLRRHVALHLRSIEQGSRDKFIDVDLATAHTLGAPRP